MGISVNTKVVLHDEFKKIYLKKMLSEKIFYLETLIFSGIVIYVFNFQFKVFRRVATCKKYYFN